MLVADTQLNISLNSYLHAEDSEALPNPIVFVSRIQVPLVELDKGLRMGSNGPNRLSTAFGNGKRYSPFKARGLPCDR